MHSGIGPEVGIRRGEVIADKYRIDRVIGVGGMGVVVAAHHLQLEELVAIKVLLDGQPLGFTPRIGVKTSPGEHRVLFRWEDADKQTSVTCTKGETKTVAVRLYEAPAEDERLERNPYR